MDVLRPLTLEAARADGITCYVNSRGEEFVQLHQRIPFAEYLYTSFERHYDTDKGVQFAREHMALPIVLVSVYMTAIYFGSKYMYRPGVVRFDLRYPLA